MLIEWQTPVELAIRMETMYVEPLLKKLQWIQPLNYLKMCSLKVHNSFNSIDEKLLGESQHAQFMLADNAEMGVMEITAALGCKFVYFPMFMEEINFSMNTYVMCSHFDTTSTSG